MLISQKFISSDKREKAFVEILSNIDLLYMCGHFEELYEILNILIEDKIFYIKKHKELYSKLNDYILLMKYYYIESEMVSDKLDISLDELKTWSMNKVEKDLNHLIPEKFHEKNQYIKYLKMSKSFSVFEAMHFFSAVQLAEEDNSYLLLVIFYLLTGEKKIAANYLADRIIHDEFRPARNANLFSMKLLVDFFRSGMLADLLGIDKAMAKNYVIAVKTKKEQNLLEIKYFNEKQNYDNDINHVNKAIIEKLEKISLIRREKIESKDIFNPGLSHYEISKLSKRLPFKLPKELYSLYEWRNGIPQGIAHTSFFRGLRFLPLEEAITLYYKVIEDLEPGYLIYEDPIFSMSMSFPFAAETEVFFSILFFPSDEHPLIKGYHPIIKYYEGSEIAFWSFDEMLDSIMVDWRRGLYNY